MNAPPFPLNPTTGERHGSWVWNGANWVCAPTTGIQVITQVFAASGPYMPSPGLVSCVVETWGGGAGGGGAVPFTPFTAMGGGGGGSGGYSRKTLPAALVMGGVQITIGAGGAGVSIPTGQPGGSGGVTSFGALCIANGGVGGQTAGAVGAGPNVTSGYGGPPAAPGVGDIAFAGNCGQTGGYTIASEEVAVLGGLGGASPLGGGVDNEANTLAGTNVNAAGPPGISPGAGGGGAANANPNAGVALPGGDGAAGLCVVTEYCWASAASGEDCWNPPVNVNARVAVTHVPWPGPGPCPPGWGAGPYIESDD